MSKMRNGIVLTLLVAVCLAGYFQDSTPENFSKPWRLQAELTLNKIMTSSLRILDDWGICSYVSTMRWLVDTRYSIDTSMTDLLIEDRLIDGVPVRVYRRKETKPGIATAALIYYHGGGWFLGSVDMYDAFMIGVVEKLDIVVISVEYRLAPEHTFPIPLEDCVKVTKYVLMNSDKLGVDTARVAVGGDSAGGNLAAAVALKLRDEKFKPMPKLQVLIYPSLQGMDLSLPSMQQNANGSVVKPIVLGEALSMYAVGSRRLTSAISKNEHTTPEVKKSLHTKHIRHDDIPTRYKYKPYQIRPLDFGNAMIWDELKETFLNPYFTPLMAADFSELPVTYIYTAHYDGLRDDGILYTLKLRDAGVDVTHFNGPNSIHGACIMPEYIEGQECINQLIEYLEKRL